MNSVMSSTIRKVFPVCRDQLQRTVQVGACSIACQVLPYLSLWQQPVFNDFGYLSSDKYNSPSDEITKPFW
jgi:hypothetical protein